MQLMLINVIMKNEQSFKKVIAAEGEHKASRALKHAAEVIADSPAALQVGFQIICHLSRFKSRNSNCESWKV